MSAGFPRKFYRQSSEFWSGHGFQFGVEPRSTRGLARRRRFFRQGSHVLNGNATMQLVVFACPMTDAVTTIACTTPATSPLSCAPPHPYAHRMLSGHNLNFLLQILALFTYTPLAFISWRESLYMLGYNILSYPMVFLVRAATSRPARNLPPLAVALSF